MADDARGAALAILAGQLGVGRLFLLDDAHGTGYGVTRYAEAAARARGRAVVGADSWTGPAQLPALVRRVRRSRADGVLLAGCYCTGGYEVCRRCGARSRAVPASSRPTR